MFSSSEASTSIRVPSSLASYILLSVFGRIYDKNTRWAAKVQETKIQWTGAKIFIVFLT